MSKRESKDSTAEPLHQRFYPLNREEALASQVTRRRKTNVDGGTKKAVDDFFQRMTEDELTGSDKLQYYEMEVDTGWLHLYAKFALKKLCLPVEMRKIIVRTREDVESKKKVKAYNAIFYISFKTRCGRDFNAIIRRTTDRLPGHFSLEVKCLI
ncbi:hypothetical protein HID58_060550 [Brassica napus]|uniref:Uncharacterized protein n=1 Tax=Brassica napus TaxID=3708 RepID=A0ABQ7ZW53_BRANA|nr:hypothetical protein HID58_060550 [Brassica napus]